MRIVVRWVSVLCSAQIDNRSPRRVPQIVNNLVVERSKPTRTRFTISLRKDSEPRGEQSKDHHSERNRITVLS